MAYFDRVSVLNMNRRADRWDSIQGKFNWLGTHFDRIEALDGRLVPPAPWWKQGGPAWCCYQGHLTGLAQALSSGHKSILLLEDDAVPCDGFREKMDELMSQVPDDWEQLYLGGHHLFPMKHPPVVIPGTRVSKPFNVNGTFAMAFRNEGIKKCYEWLLDVEDWIRWPRHHVDHRLGIGHERKKWKVYAASPFLIGHAAGSSNISGQVTSSDVYFSAPRTNPSDRLAPDPPVMVLGPFRGGTSIVTRILAELGVQISRKPGRLVGNAGKDAYDPYEDPELANIMRRRFKEPTMAARGTHEQFMSELRTWLAHRQIGSKGQRWGAKHPSLCLAIPQLYEIMGSEWVALSVLRSPDDVVKSHMRVKWWSKENADQTTKLLIHHRDEGLFRHKAQLKVSVVYDELISDPESTIRQLAAALKMTPTEAQIQKAVECVRTPSKRLRPKASQGSYEPPTDGQLPVVSYWEGNMPRAIEAMYASFLVHNPDARIFTQKSVLELMESRDVASDILDAFPKQLVNQQSDIFRSFFLHHFGGVWWDADCVHFRPTSELLATVPPNFQLATYKEHTGNRGWVCTAFIAAKKTSKIAEEFWDTHCRLMRAKQSHQLNRYGPMTLAGANRRTKGEWPTLIDVKKVMPLHFGKWSKNISPISKGQFRLLVPDGTYSYMVTHSTFHRMAMWDANQIYNSNTLISRCIRRGLEGTSWDKEVLDQQDVKDVSDFVGTAILKQLP